VFTTSIPSFENEEPEGEETAYDGDVTVHDLWDLDAEIDQSQKAREAKGGNSSS
jgi:hypothetical protein